MKTDLFVQESNRTEFHNEAPAKADAFDLALHTRKPFGADQSDGEVTLKGYARVSVPRTAEHWTVSGRDVANKQPIAFPAGTTTAKQKAAWVSIGIGGKIRRLLELPQAVELGLNLRAEFDPGELKITEAGQ